MRLAKSPVPHLRTNGDCFGQKITGYQEILLSFLSLFLACLLPLQRTAIAVGVLGEPFAGTRQLRRSEGNPSAALQQANFKQPRRQDDQTNDGDNDY